MKLSEVDKIRRDLRRLWWLRLLCYFPPTTLFVISIYANLKWRLESESEERQALLEDADYYAAHRAWLEGCRNTPPPRPRMRPFRGTYS